MVFLPYDVHFCFQDGGQGTEAEAAVGIGVGQVVECEHAAQPLFYKYGTVVGKIDCAGEIQQV